MTLPLNHEADFWETVRARWYPRLDPLLRKVGGYGEGYVGDRQYVGVVREDEDAIEAELEEVGAVRNPVAAYKSLDDGRESEGSWRILHDARPDLVEPGMQLHITLFIPKSGTGRAVYAHYEDDWEAAPVAHLRGRNFSAEKGVEKAREAIDESSFLLLKDA